MAALLVFFSVSLILLAVLFHKRKSSLSSRKRPPPSPLRLPVIGHFHLIGALSHRSFTSLSKRYGEVMLLHFGSAPVLVASSAAAAREIMKNQDVIFASRPRLSIFDRLMYSGKGVAFAPYGEHWRNARSMCMLQLLSAKRVQSFGGIREEETSAMIEKIRRSKPTTVVNLSEMFMALTNGVIHRAVLGRKGDGGDDFNRILIKVIKLLGSFNVGDYVPWLSWINRINGVDAEVEKVGTKLDGSMEGILRKYRRKKVGDDETNFVDTLLQFQRESKDTDPVEDDVIKALIFDMVSAGTDTTFAALEWTMAELIKNPRTLKTLQNEVREVSRNKGGITEDDVDKMPYLKAVSKEILRLHPPFAILLPRELTQDANMLGYDIPRGTVVLVNNWAISRDPSLWENPEEFRPERFLETSIDYKGLHFEMLPFGSGRRGCPGSTFAMALYELALSKLVNEFDFRLGNGDRAEDLDMTEAPGFVVHKKSPLLVLATPRQS
uniref:(+)-menthofuran synthase n=1 Tax=Mentha piperita TaxID=34256 RepID=MFS_MENPI|nr:RecName: Full=(+)-menthofuran synthase; AltName: Full=(+)-pulegone 9-hydroxylase [Mentha x piperita]AAL06397.1 menthofuran synthase [Mentha x piperita]ABW86888.1 menthofuran synthase [Mentha x piperita]